MAKKNSTSAAQTAASTNSEIFDVASDLEEANSLLNIYCRLLTEQTSWTLSDIDESEDAQSAIIALMRVIRPELVRVEAAKDKLYELARVGVK